MQRLIDFDAPPVATARWTDPSTSHASADAHEESGSAESHRQLVERVVKAAPGLTYREIAEAAGLEHHEAMKRLNDLRRTGKVYQGAERRYGRRMCVTWWPV